MQWLTLGYWRCLLNSGASLKNKLSLPWVEITKPLPKQNILSVYVRFKFQIHLKLLAQISGHLVMFSKQVLPGMMQFAQYRQEEGASLALVGER